MENTMFWARRLVIGLITMLGIGLAGLLIFQQLSDGPTGPLPGGTFSSGEPASIENWQQLEGDFEFELVGQGRSRTAGGMVVDGNLYISCDLGFIWSRLPPGTGRTTLNLIWLLKDWHERALEDGRIRIRKNGRIYSAVIERVEDPQLLELLKVTVEDLANQFFTADLGPRPTEPPNDIWFFRVRQP